MIAEGFRGTDIQRHDLGRCAEMLKTVVAAAALSLSFVNAHAALYSRLGGQAVYDSDLNITWTADANLAATLPFGLANTAPSPDSGNQPGSMWGTRRDAWIDALNAYQGTGYLGFDDWRLTSDNCTSAGYGCTNSEFGHLFYDELGGSAHQPVGAAGRPYLSLFSNIVQNNWYWTGDSSGEKIKVFNFGDGSRSEAFGTLMFGHVWAVRDGDVASTVPEPAIYALVLVGLGLFGLTHKSRRLD